MEGLDLDFSGLLIFLVLVVPGVIARKARDAITPRSLKPQSAVAELGDYVLDSVFVHLLLLAVTGGALAVAARSFFDQLGGDLAANSLSDVVVRHPRLAFSYLLLSFPAGYVFGFVRGWQIMRQPIRSRMFENGATRRLFGALGITSFLAENPVWYDVFAQQRRNQNVFVEVEMKEGHGLYTGLMKAYGILDDSEKCKDFYVVQPYFRSRASDPYDPLNCDGVLLNFVDVASIRIKKEEFPTQPAPPTVKSKD